MYRLPLGSSADMVFFSICDRGVYHDFFYFDKGDRDDMRKKSTELRSEGDRDDTRKKSTELRRESNMSSEFKSTMAKSLAPLRRQACIAIRSCSLICCRVSFGSGRLDRILSVTVQRLLQSRASTLDPEGMSPSSEDLARQLDSLVHLFDQARTHVLDMMARDSFRRYSIQQTPDSQ
jgi:hypothetical protein